MPNPSQRQSPLRGQTQWTAQFLVAAELVRRRYVVSFTMGNDAPNADLIVSHEGRRTPFWVDVKGSVRRNGWFIKQKPHLDRLYYILVEIAKERKDDLFFILSQEELANAVREYSGTHDVKLGHEKVRIGKVEERYGEGNWKRLPRRALL